MGETAEPGKLLLEEGKTNSARDAQIITEKRTAQESLESQFPGSLPTVFPI
jgi:hypothetical protein